MPDKSQITAYLQRIGISGEVSPDLAGLNTLIRAQLTHVPFEALDVWGSGECPSLRIDDLFQKIVVDRRGGYCFELNTLFRVLLNSLGFDAYQVIASLVDEQGIAAPPAHNGIVCTLDGQKYFIDVGFGGPVPFFAMALREGTQENFRLERQGDFWYLYRLSEGEQINFIRFRDIAAEPCELEPLNFYISQKPDIHFRHILRVNQRREDGIVYSLVDHELTVHTPQGNRVIPIGDRGELDAALEKYFGIDPKKLKINKEY